MVLEWLRQRINEFSKKVSSGPLKNLYRPILFLIITLIVATVISPYFLSTDNIMSILISSSPLMILTIGQTIVILTGMIDLGAEATLACSSVLIAYLNLYTDLPVAVIITLTLLFGVLIGLINGILVTKAKIPSFICTLGMYWGLRGIGMLISGAYPLVPSIVTPTKPFGFGFLASRPFGIPIMIVLAFSIVIVFQILLSQYSFGKHVYAIGGNENAARNCGIRTGRVKILVFVIMGALGAFSGIVMCAWINEGYAWIAQGYSLQSVAGTVLGGVSFSGGIGTVMGAAIGAFVLGIINDLIVLLGVSPLWTYVVIAVVLVLAGIQLRVKGFVK